MQSHAWIFGGGTLNVDAILADLEEDFLSAGL